MREPIPHELGLIFRAARLLAGRRQADVGAAIGYSASAISRIENGQLVPDLPTAAALAAELGISLEQLGLAALRRPGSAGTVTDNPIQESDPVRRRELLAGALGIGAGMLATPAVAAPRPPSVDTATALERALFQPHHASPVPLPRLQDALTQARTAFRGAHYDELGTGLPRLFAIATATRDHATGITRDQASGALARSYVLATELAVKAHQDHAWATADRALTAARDSGDPVVIGEAARVLSVAMRRTGRYDAATELLEHTALTLGADRGDPDPATLAVYGSLLLTAAYTAAQGHRPAAAVHFVQEAEQAAARMPVGAAPQVFVSGEFSPEQCALFRIGIHHHLGQDADALQFAKALDPDRLPTPERRARYCTDLARAWQGYGKPDRAYQALRAAELYAPQEVRRPSLRAMTSELLYQPGDIPGLREFAERTGAIPA